MSWSDLLSRTGFRQDLFRCWGSCALGLSKGAFFCSFLLVRPKGEPV
jgi:hypothetical protein